MFAGFRNPSMLGFPAMRDRSKHGKTMDWRRQTFNKRLPVFLSIICVDDPQDKQSIKTFDAKLNITGADSAFVKVVEGV